MISARLKKQKKESHVFGSCITSGTCPRAWIFKSLSNEHVWFAFVSSCYANLSFQKIKFPITTFSWKKGLVKELDLFIGTHTITWSNTESIDYKNQSCNEVTQHNWCLNNKAVRARARQVQKKQQQELFWQLSRILVRCWATEMVIYSCLFF